MKKLTDAAGFVGNFTCHSFRATVASRLFENGIDEQLIQEQTGHSSTAVRRYKRTSDSLKRKVSNVLQNEDCSKKAKDETSITEPCLHASTSTKEDTDSHVEININKVNDIVK